MVFINPSFTQPLTAILSLLHTTPHSYLIPHSHNPSQLSYPSFTQPLTAILSLLHTTPHSYPIPPSHNPSQLSYPSFTQPLTAILSLLHTTPHSYPIPPSYNPSQLSYPSFIQPLTAILLGTLRMGYQDVKKLVLTVNDEKLSEQMLQQFLKFMPNREEVS